MQSAPSRRKPEEKPYHLRVLIALIHITLCSSMALPKPSRAQVDSPANQITVYCVGNQDSTGSCRAENTDKQLDIECLIAGWPIVKCRSQSDGTVIEASNPAQTSYACLALPNTGIVNQVALSCTTEQETSAAVPSPGSLSDIDQPALEPTASPSDQKESYSPAEANTGQKDNNLTSAGVWRDKIERGFSPEKPTDFKDAFQ